MTRPADPQEGPAVPLLPIRFVDVNVADLDRSIDFYGRHLELPVIDTPHRGDDEAWLDGGPVVVRLHRQPQPAPSRWIPDDLQLGFRHFGFRVTGIDERVELLHEADVRFHLEPLDATGGVRIAFFYDPDGVLLEFIQGTLDYHRVWNESIVADLEARPAPTRPTFDHVAVTTRDQTSTIDFYRRTLGFDVSGQLFLDEDPRGFEITYLHAGDTVIEVFTFAPETSPSPWSSAETTIGFRHVGFDADVEVVERVTAAGGSPVTDASCTLVLDRDGFPLALEGLGGAQV
jgi:catechol 2,3-dioxygenase-like lactoylglutathione lyase family enzyme